MDPLSVAERLQELGLELPTVPQPRGSYVPAVVHDGMCFAAGQLPFLDGVVACRGKVGREVSLEEGRAAAELAALNALAAVNAALGSLDEVVRVLRLTGYVNCTDDFAEQHLIVNGASDLLQGVFGDLGSHARTSIGMNALPLGAAVEIELTFAIRRS